MEPTTSERENFWNAKTYAFLTATDRNLRRILRDYRRSLDRGTPLGFTFGETAKAAEGALPIRARGGYQLAWMGDRARRVWVAYLRSRKVGKFGKQFLGVPVPRRLELQFDLPQGEYHAALIDLDRNRVNRYRLAHNSGLNVSERTDADYVLIVSAEPIDNAFRATAPACGDSPAPSLRRAAARCGSPR